jgi:hypothetical protein
LTIRPSNAFEPEMIDGRIVNLAPGGPCGERALRVEVQGGRRNAMAP